MIALLLLAFLTEASVGIAWTALDEKRRKRKFVKGYCWPMSIHDEPQALGMIYVEQEEIPEGINPL